MTRKIEGLGRVTANSIWDVIDLYPMQIQPACHTLATIPTTQVLVERCFSHLRLLIRDNRASLMSDLTARGVALPPYQQVAVGLTDDCHEN